MELGCTNGILSYHLATILGKFNSASSLCCVCDTIGNSSGNQWLDRISLVQEMPGLSMLAADYDNTQLADRHFDIVVINGSVQFEQPDYVIREAERVVKKNGLILCYAQEQPLLESSFQLLFAKREEYQLNPRTNIMAVTYEEASWGRDEGIDLEAEAQNYLRWVRKALEGALGKDEIRELVRRMNKDIDIAIEKEDYEKKLWFIDVKEQLLDCLVRQT